MRVRHLALPRLFLLQICGLLIPVLAWSQAIAPQSRITQTVNDAALTTLKGNTHPLAQAQFDRGAAPPDLPMARMLLVLKRSDAQEAALEKLLEDQQDQGSPSYHQWLTPDQFGQQFGPSDQDIQAVTAWLRSHGFQIGQVGRGRTVIEFSGTAAQVQQAFRTEIHKFTVNGEDHWANASDPQIPAALLPVVVGVDSLHNFPKNPLHHVSGVFSRSRATGQVRALTSDFTFPDSSRCVNGGNCYLVGPYDFAKIYNVLPLWNETPAIDGTGQTIAIVGVSNINIQDVRDFRNLFGLPAKDPQVILDGPDPGLVPDAETEADLDVEWAGAVAKGATIILVPSASTNAIYGVDLSAVYVIENNLAPILSESFGDCELFLGTAGNSFVNAIREQAAAQGITFINSSGDEGVARCDSFSGTAPSPATHGFTVNGLASSPHDVAVGGTDFANFTSASNINSPSPYWNLSTDPTQPSALGYVPETTWNNNCTNNIVALLGWGANAEAVCNNSNTNIQQLVETIAGGGGKSNCITSDGANTSSCSGGYAKPPWQSAPGVPQDNARDIPDVSLFASGGFMDSAYVICEADKPSPHGSCSLTSIDSTFLTVGGTSVSAPAFAGIMALVNQYMKAAGQGNANYVLYKLASSQTQKISSCNASGPPASTCIFNDVTAGTIDVPCAANTPSCSPSNGDAFGVIGYSAGVGYDLATGLGSVNAYNLVHDWSPPTVTTTTTLSLNSGKALSFTHGQSVPVSITVSPSAATGDVLLIGSPNAGSSIAMGSFTLQNGAASGTTSTLAGSGATSYQVVARYAGDATYAPSDSSPVSVMVAPEPSNTLITIPVFDPTTGKETGNTPISVVYGSPYIARMDVANAQEMVTFPMKPLCAPLSCPTGSVTLADSVAGTTTALGVFPLNVVGYADYLSIQLTGGVHQLTANYPGDNSFGPNKGSYNLTVTPAPAQMSVLGFSGPVIAGTQIDLSAVVTTGVYSAAAPTGTFSFYDGTTALTGNVVETLDPGTATLTAGITGQLWSSFSTSGTHQISAKYSGDANYAAATSPATNVSVLYATTAAETASATTINFGANVTVTATVTSTVKSPPMTGTFQFTAANPIGGPVTPTLGTDASGNQVLTASVTTSLPNSNFIQVTYSGDANYESTNAGIFIIVVLPDFNMGTAVPSLTLTAGQSGSTQVTLTPLNSISSSVNLTCNTSIAGATCSFNPSSQLSLSNEAAASTTFVITTLPPSSSPTTTFVGIRPPSVKPTLPQGLRMIALADALALLLTLIFAARRRHRTAARVGLIGLLGLVLGCSGGNGGGGGGGGNPPPPTPTSLTLSTSAVKAASGANVTFSVSVTSSNTATGLVTLLDSGGAFTSANVVNGTATFPQLTFLSVGTHMISAQYGGDSRNQSSQTSGSINEVITGTASAFVVASSPQVSHTASVNVTIQ